MKKLFALLAVVLAVVSCQRDADDLNVAMGGEQEVMLTVSLPEATRADSALGFNLQTLGTTYDLRYILEVYRVTESGVLYDTCQRFVETSDGTSMVFPVRLAPGYNYRIVAWADIVDEGSKADRYYYTEDGLDNVVIKDNNTVHWNAMDETRDAYTYVNVVNNFQSTSNLDMTLTRPFAKVRVVATDITDIRKVCLEPTTATVEYSQDMYFKYNAVADVKNEGVAEGAKAKSHTYTYAQTATKYDDTTGEFTLFTDYIFVPASGTAKFELTVKDKEGGEIKYNHFNTEISVERNKLTTIKGDVLTTGGNINVTVDNGLEELKTITIVDTAESLQEVIKNAEDNTSVNIELGGDIDLGDLFSAGTLSTRASATLPIVIAEGKVVALDLNGHKITTPFVEGSTTNHAYAFENHGNLTIKDSKGNGKIVARGNYNYGTMTLESGTINACDGNGGYGVLNYEGATFTMTDGSITTCEDDDKQVDNGGYDATTLRVENGATAFIKGGFINNISDYTFAIDNYGTTTINGGTISSIHTTVTNYGAMTINDGSFTCNGIEGKTQHVLWAAEGTTTINGGTFDGKDNYNGFNVDASEGATVYIKGGKFLPVHSGSLYGEGTIEVTDGEFFDDPSARVAEGYKAVKGENGYWTIANDPAAQIGATKYDSLQEAFNVGGDITLLRNVTIAEPVVLAEGKTAVLNLNGKTITGTMHKSVGHVIQNGGTLTVKNGTIKSTANNGGSAVMNTGRMTIEKVTLNGARNADGSWPSYTVNNTGTMTVENTTITSYHGAVASYGDGALVTLNNCTIDMAGIPGFTSHGIYTYNNGKVVVNGGTYENKATDQNSSGASVINGAVEVNAGTFSGRIENYYGTPVLKGGTFSVKPNAKFIAEGYKAIQNEDDSWSVVDSTVAMIGETKYATLNDAVAAVKDGDTITLVSNEVFTTENRTLNSGTWYDGLYYVGDKSYTIDLGGNTIRQDGAVNDYLLNFKNVGSKANTITLKNGTIDAGTTAFCALCTASSHDNLLTINIENVTIYNNISNGSTAKIRGGAILNVNDGAKIIGKNSYLGIECVASTVNIYNGAEIYMNGTSSYNGCLAGACGGGTINVYGGYGKGVKGGFIAMTSGGTINVSGGEWIANTDGAIGNNSNLYVLTAQSNIQESGFVGGAYINVTGGTFRGGMDAWVLNNHKDEEAKLSISGGNFNANPTTYLEEGYTATENNGIYTVSANN